MIPKIIHQIYWDFSNKNKPIPIEWKKAQKGWLDHHPGWKYKLWTDEDNLLFLQQYYPWFVEIFVNYPHPIQRADAIRPFLLYHFGGLYADMDMYCVQPFDDILTKDGVYILESAHTGLANCLMASSKKNPFWENVIQEFMIHKDKKWYQTHHLYIMSSTGTKLITDCFHKYKKPDMYVLPNKVFNPCNVCEKTCQLKPEYYSYTIYSGSWNAIDSKIFNVLFCYKYLIICIVVFLALFLIYKNKDI